MTVRILTGKRPDNPASTVDWVIVQDGDLVSQHINTLLLIANFSEIPIQSNTTHVFRKNGLPPLPSRALPANFLFGNLLCRNGLG